MNSVTRKLALFVALVAMALAATPAAFAQSSGDGYRGPGGTINERVDPGNTAGAGDSGTASPGTSSSDNGGNGGNGGSAANGGDRGDSTLPFTGSDLGLLAGAGALLLGLGVGMRRLTTRRADPA